MSWTIGLVIELDLDIMLISIVTKFGEDPIRIVRVRERKPKWTPPAAGVSIIRPVF